MAGVLDISSSPDENWWEIYPTMWILPRRGRGIMAPTLIWRNPVPTWRRSVSPSFWLSLVFVKSTSPPILTKNFRRPPLAVEFLLLFTFDFRVLLVSRNRTHNQARESLWRTDCCCILQMKVKNATTSFQTLYRQDMVTWLSTDGQLVEEISRLRTLIGN